MSGAEVKQAIVDSGLKLWQVAYAFGISDSSFSRKLRKDFTESETERIFAIIEQLKKTQ